MADKYTQALEDSWAGNAMTAPFRALLNTLRVPVDAGVDAASAIGHGALGLEPADPMGRTKRSIENVRGALTDFATPVFMGGETLGRGQDAISSFIADMMTKAREGAITGGAKPKADPTPTGAIADPMETVMRARGGPAMAVAPRPSPGALPAPQGRATGPARSDMTALPQAGNADETARSVEALLTEAPAGATATAAAAPAAPVAKGLADQYAELIAKIPKGAGGALTPQQKAQAQLDFFLGLMARGAKPGSTLISNVGESGLEVSGKAKQDMKENKASETAARKEAMDEALRQIGFADKDADNARGDRRESREEKRWETMDKREREKLELTRQQFEASGWTLQEGGDGSMYAINPRTRETQKLPIKGKGNRNQQIEFYQWLSNNPKARELFLEGKGQKMSDEDVVKEAVKLVNASMGSVTLDDAISQIRKNTGGGQQGGAAALPAGVPPGSKQIGTSKGKPVFETPDGKRLIVD